MAVWQYSCSLIPKTSITINDIADQIRAIFGAEFEHSDRVMQFGSYEGNICSAYTKNNTISLSRATSFGIARKNQAEMEEIVSHQ